jgi:hypothetical protein
MMMRSRCASVLVRQTAEDVDAFDPINYRQRGHRPHGGGHRDVQADTAMGAAAVVVLEVTGEDSLQVPSVPYQRAVQTVRMVGRRVTWTGLTQVQADGGSGS